MTKILNMSKLVDKYNRQLLKINQQYNREEYYKYFLKQNLINNNIKQRTNANDFFDIQSLELDVFNQIHDNYLISTVLKMLT